MLSSMRFAFCFLCVVMALSSRACFGNLVVSCDFRSSENRCQERRGTQAANPLAFQSICETANGVYSSNACPTASIVAGCRDGDVTDWYYPPRTMAEVQAECAEDGWTFVTP